MRPHAFSDNVQMTLTAHFIDAHERHWEDAELLFECRRWANADQLYGFSAECGLKAVLEAEEMPIDETGMPSHEFRKHVRELWPVFIEFMTKKEISKPLWDEFPDGEPFKDWSHHDRYAHRGCFRSDKVQQHRDAAKAISHMVKQYLQDSGHEQ